MKIWLAAADLESDSKAKKRVLRRGLSFISPSSQAKYEINHSTYIALEHIPNSVRLWKETVNLEESATDARVLLARATEVIPLSVELWLALARLETPANAKKVLNSARKAVPTSHEIWIAAGRLLEQEANNPEKSSDLKIKELAAVDNTIELAVRELRKHGVLLTREQWLKEAEQCESQGSIRTCEAIVKATVAMEVEEEDRLDTWVSDAEGAESKRMVGTARAILAYALKVYPDRRNLWRRAAELEKTHGTRYVDCPALCLMRLIYRVLSRESLDALLIQAVKHCPQAEVLWLMAAKEKWLAGDVPAAREVLERAFNVNPESEEIWLAAVKLESENGNMDVARQLLQRARDVADTDRVSDVHQPPPTADLLHVLFQIWMKSAVFERQLGQYTDALQTLETALTKFPKFPKFYMMQGQIHQKLKNTAAARKSYGAGMKACPKSITLCILTSRLEEADGKSIKARALLEKARLVNPANDELWAESVGVEERSGSAVQAKAMLSRGLQDCPASGLLWSLSIWSEPRPMRKTRSVDALKKSSDNPIIICTVARLFWADRSIEKARHWFNRAAATAPDLGDTWGWWLKFERMHGVEEQREEVRKKCVAAEPHHSPVWQGVAKDDANRGKGVGEILEMVADALQ